MTASEAKAKTAGLKKGDVVTGRIQNVYPDNLAEKIEPRPTVRRVPGGRSKTGAFEWILEKGKWVVKKGGQSLPIIGAGVTILFAPKDASAAEVGARVIAGEIGIGPFDLETAYDVGAPVVKEQIHGAQNREYQRAVRQGIFGIKIGPPENPYGHKSCRPHGTGTLCSD